MGNLIPEKRMNVNGHLVTKHVRAASGLPLHRKPLHIPPVSQFSQEFGASLASASAIVESIYSFKDNDQMVNARGQEVHDYGYEEARDVMTDLFPSATLKNLESKLNGLPEGRLKVLLAEQVYLDISYNCELAQKGEEITPIGRLALKTVNDGIELSQFADAFADEDADTANVIDAIYWASRTVRRECSTDEWKLLLPTEQDYRQMVEGEFIVNFITNSSLSQEGDKTPDELHRHRRAVLENADRIKKHQKIFRDRGVINLDILDELDGTASAIREGAL